MGERGGRRIGILRDFKDLIGGTKAVSRPYQKGVKDGP